MMLDFLDVVLLGCFTFVKPTDSPPSSLFTKEGSEMDLLKAGGEGCEMLVPLISALFSRLKGFDPSAVSSWPSSQK
jgi:hypothetical protein